MSGAVEGAAKWLYEIVFPRVGGWERCSPENREIWIERVTHLASRTTPPARSYADGVEDAAKAVEALRREVPYEYNKHPCSETKRRAIAAIRLLSQGGKA